MMWYTHAVTAWISLSFLTKSPVLIFLGVMAALLPDIDNPNTIIGKLLFPLSHYINKCYGHRTITHSFAALLLVFSAGLLGSLNISLSLVVGYLSHLLLDMLNPSGIPLFYPNITEFVLFGGPVTVGSIAELALFGLLFASAFALGILSFFNFSPVFLLKSILADSSDVYVDQWKKMSRNNIVQANVKGYWYYSNKYVELEGNVTDGEGSVIFIESNKSIYSVSSKEKASINPMKIELKTIGKSKEEIILKQKEYSGYGEFLSSMNYSLLSGSIYFYNEIQSDQKFEIEQTQSERPEGVSPIKTGSHQLSFRRAPLYLFEKIKAFLPNSSLKTGLLSVIV